MLQTSQKETMKRKDLAVIINNSAQNILQRLLLLGMLSFGTEATIHAYTDPGSGAMIWQTFVMGIAGAIFYWRRILRWFKSKKSSPE